MISRGHRRRGRSEPETSDLVRRRRDSLGIALDHVSQADEATDRSRILDLAALQARGDHLVFLDGDCVPRRGMLQGIRRAALPGGSSRASGSI